MAWNENNTDSGDVSPTDSNPTLPSSISSSDSTSSSSVGDTSFKAMSKTKNYDVLESHVNGGYEPELAEQQAGLADHAPSEPAHDAHVPHSAGSTTIPSPLSTGAPEQFPLPADASIQGTQQSLHNSADNSIFSQVEVPADSPSSASPASASLNNHNFPGDFPQSPVVTTSSPTTRPSGFSSESLGKAFHTTPPLNHNFPPSAESTSSVIHPPPSNLRLTSPHAHPRSSRDTSSRTATRNVNTVLSVLVFLGGVFGAISVWLPWISYTSASHTVSIHAAHWPRKFVFSRQYIDLLPWGICVLSILIIIVSIFWFRSKKSRFCAPITGILSLILCVIAIVALIRPVFIMTSFASAAGGIIPGIGVFVLLFGAALVAFTSLMGIYAGRSSQ